MQDRNKRAYSIDGFEPRKAASRTIGFNAVKQATQQQYPSVGMTLSSYKPTNNASSTLNGAYELPTPQSKPVQKLNPKQKRKQKPPIQPLAPQKSKNKRRISKKLIVVIVLLILLIPTAWLGFKVFNNVSKVFQGNVFSALTTTKLDGEDQGRVNILLAGNSADDPLHQGAELTDSIMLVSIDTQNKSGFMLSVPRDLWVNIPGYGYSKINEAYVNGENDNFDQSGYFPGGMGLLQKVVEENFDIDLNYYGLINYNAFRDMVNAVGGIEVNIQSSDKRGLYDPNIDWTTRGPLVKLTNGVHTLNGQQALNLARARGDAYNAYGFEQSDFTRTQHQRQELLALRAKATSSGVLANPVKLSGLLDAVGNNVKTDFELNEVRRLHELTKDIPATSIQSLSLNDARGKNLLANYRSASGESALAPEAGVDDFSDIQTFMKQVTSNNTITREGATVVVLNATDTSGLAANAQAALVKKGAIVSRIGSAETKQTTSSIIDISGNKYPATKALLMQQYGQSVTTTNPYANLYDADFIVLIGADKIPKPTTTPNP